MKKNQTKHGIIFWITGLSGSGKTSLAKKITNFVNKNYGPTLCLHGDELRKTFNIKSYNKKDRLMIGKMYVKLIKMIAEQKINVIISVVGLFHELQKLNRKTFANYLEIFIKSDIKLLKSKKNLGPGNARNIGLKKASGKKIIFLDVEDYLFAPKLKRLIYTYKEKSYSFLLNFDKALSN